MGISKRGRRCSRLGTMLWQAGRLTPRSAAAAVLSLAALVGCGGNSKTGPATVEARGTVTLGGKPVEDANVVFYPDMGLDGARLTSQAITDREGRFRLRTHVGGGKFKPGIIPGQYSVAISKLDTAAIKTMLAPPKNLLPRKYADPKSSQLRAEVAAGRENDFPFALQGE